MATSEFIDARKTLIMGIVNVTPDSFSDGGRYVAAQKAIEHGLKLSEEGADMVDIGGESTRPGAAEVTVEEELSRVIPVIEGLKKAGVKGLSIDTTKAAVAAAAVEAGASMINDISGLAYDSGMARVAAKAGVPIVIGHVRGTPKTMQKGEITYSKGVVSAVKEALTEAIARAEAAGILRARVLVDPGIGFGKTVPQNLELLANLHLLAELRAPIVIGTSRKSFLGALTGRPVDEREHATSATTALAAAFGAHMVRVHDVSAAKDVLRVADPLVQARLT